MATFIEFLADVEFVTRKIVGQRVLKEFINSAGREFSDETRDEIIVWLSRNVGTDLDDNGRAFLVALAKWTAREFPEDMK